MQTQERFDNEVEDETGAEANTRSSRAIPRADIFETTEEFVIICDMPGVKPNAVDLELERGQLFLSGNISPRPVHGRLLEQEYDIGYFTRSFSIASEVDTSKISAECCDGVVTLHLPKKESAKPKHISVKHK